jgi:hypothetical protein
MDMNMRNLKQIHSLAKYPMTIVMAQAWFLSTRLCVHARRDCGILEERSEI